MRPVKRGTKRKEKNEESDVPRTRARRVREKEGPSNFMGRKVEVSGGTRARWSNQVP